MKNNTSDSSISFIETSSSSEITDRVSSFSHISELEVYEADYQIKNGNFESGNLDGWYKEDESAPFEVINDDVDIWNNPVAKQGAYFLGVGVNNYSSEYEAKTGKIRSSLFKMNNRGIITFSLAGGSQKELTCYLMKYNNDKDDEVVKTFNNSRFSQGGLSGFILVSYYLYVDAAKYADSLMYLILEDNSQSSFAFISIDDIITLPNSNARLFASCLVGYGEPTSIEEAFKGAELLEAEPQLFGKKYFLNNESFNTNNLLVITKYSNGVYSLAPRKSYMTNQSKFRKGVAGNYEIDGMVMNTNVGFKYEVEVLGVGEHLPGSIEINDESKLLLIGDSQMDFWDNAKEDIGAFNNYANIALGGTTTDYWIEKLPSVIAQNPDVILFNIGGNDIRNKHMSVSEVITNVRYILNQIKASLPNTHVFLFSTVGGKATFYNYFDKIYDLNIEYAKLENEMDNLTFLNVMPLLFDDDGLPSAEYFKSDNLHYSPEAYKVLAAEFNKYLIK